MRKSIVTVTLFLAALTAALSTDVSAGVIPPSGLAPGSRYQVVFVTLAVTDATSADIGYYNNFVQADAEFGAAHSGLPAGLTWHAIASTPTIDARDNAPSVGLPVYNTHGQLVAAASLYSGSLLTPVLYNENGSTIGIANAAVWTGSDASGVGIPGLTLGAASTNAALGGPQATDANWTDFISIPQLNTYALYALSSPITVPIPEPATLTLLGSALLLLCGFRFLRRRWAT